MKRILLAACAFALASVRAADEPTADGAAVVTAGNARFTVLTDRMIRMEYAPDGKFEDRASLTFVNRRLPVPHFRKSVKDGGCTIDTGALKLAYSGGAFARETLRIDGKGFSWRYGDEDKGNLLGTRRTLDGVSSWKNLLPWMEKGLLSRDGWTVVDDSKNLLFERTDDAWGNWCAVRPEAHQHGYRDVYFFGYGHDYKGCLGDYVKVAGRIPLPPRWAFGFWWSRYWLYTDAEVRELVGQMRSVGVPLDVFVLDMEWHETWSIMNRPDVNDEFGQMWGWTGYTWNKRLFPDPKSTLDFLHDNGCKVTLNLHPASGIQPVEECYGDFCKAYGWKGTNAVPYRASERKWCDAYFDTVLGPLERQGVDFWWLDWQQWGESKYVPRLNNTFWLNYVFDRHMAMRNGGSERPFIYHRWGGLGSHRYQVGFSGDSSVRWSMLETIPWFTATASNVAYGYWGHDIGGHFGTENYSGLDGELFTRWLQSGVFTPIFKIHSTKDPYIERRIWKYPEHFMYLREALDLRYRLAPYIYTAARQAYDTGVSICRPMYYEEPENDAAYAVSNAYFFGESIISATISRPMDKKLGFSEVELWLPKGTWYDVANGDLLQGGKTHQLQYGIDQNPWFAKAGAIIPMYPKSVRNLAKVGTDEIELFFVPGADSGSCEIYEDDGVNPDYAVNCRRTRVVRKGNRIAISPRAGSYTLRFPCLAAPRGVKVNGRQVPWTYDVSDLSVVVKTPRLDGKDKTLVELDLPSNAAETQKKLVGLKGEFRRVDRLSEPFKGAVSAIGWAMNTPESWQSLWQTPAELAAHPADLEKVLARRETYRKEFRRDLGKLAHRLPQDLYKKLNALALGAGGKSRTIALIPERDATKTWRYTFSRPPEDWTKPGFNDASWSVSAAGFASFSTPDDRKIVVSTKWTTPDIWIRKPFQYGGEAILGAWATMFHDEDVDLYVNGELVAKAHGFNSSYVPTPLDPMQLEKLLRKGRNELAVHVHQTEGGQCIDLGLFIDTPEK